LRDNIGKYIGIGISFPLLSGFERFTNQRKLKLNLYRLKNEEELEKQQLYTEIEQTLLSLRAGYTEHQQVLQQLSAETLVLKESERRRAYLCLSVNGSPQSFYFRQSRTGSCALAGRNDDETGEILPGGNFLIKAEFIYFE
jgi:hypothetical protein